MMVGKVIKPLISFDMIFNTGIGMLRFLRECMYDDYLIDVDKLKGTSDSEMLSLFLSNPTRNPFFPYTREKYHDISFLDKMEDDYKSILGAYHKDILKYAAFTDFGTSVIGMAINIIENINPTIVVKSELEKSHIKKYEELSKCKIIVTSDLIREKEFINPSEPWIRDYDPFYIEYLDEIIPQKEDFLPPHLERKNIYLKDCEYNSKKLEEIRENGLPIADNCAFTFISLWAKENNNNG